MPPRGTLSLGRRAAVQVLRECRLSCSDLPSIAAVRLESEAVERLVGVARSMAVGEASSPPQLDEKDCLPLPPLCFRKALDVMGPPDWDMASEEEPAVAEGFNEAEKALLREVVRPADISSGFDDIGALEEVKEALREVVLLPLMRPDLFSRGTLTKAVKGVLLFGPPGTGKTLLAKAVAKEAGATFLNIPTSVISSKWYGDAEKLVCAVFSLATKMAPAVVFLDEVDGFLGARGEGGEHEATRKMRNEFLSNWDGLRGGEKERVLVLAATNRPFDLDEAVIRRMPRRIMVPLPTAANREKILRVLLGAEELEEGFEWRRVAEACEGYSGSDLKNLCVAAAYRPIREVIAKEKESGQWEWTPPTNGGKAGRRPGGAPPPLRPLVLNDFLASMAQVGASVSLDTRNQIEMQRWNEKYGEGGSRKKKGFGFATGMD